MSKKSFLYYLSCLLLLALLVIIKQHAITKKNQKEAISLYSSWKTEGKPVLAQEAKKNNLEANWKITLALDSDNTYIGYVPKAVVRTLTLSSPAFIDYQGKNRTCAITEIASKADLATGMYLIKIHCEETLGGKEEKYPAQIATSRQKNVLLLPHDAIHTENSEPFVWIIKENKVHKQPVTLGERNSKGIIASGVEENDLIVLSGSALQENDTVKITSGN
jgi:hypothetical protein